MGMTKSELQELIQEGFDKAFTDSIGRAFKESDIYKQMTKVQPNKLLMPDNAEYSNRLGFDKSYNKIFGKRENSELSKGNFEDLDDYFTAIKNAGISPDKRLKDMSELVGSEGGFGLPAEFEKQILDTNLEDEIVRPRAKVYGLKRARGNSLTVPGTADTDHSSFEVAGVKSYWGSEGASKTEGDPKLRQIEMKVNELYNYTESSDILIEDSAIPISDMVGKLFFQSLRWRFDYSFLNGTGGGQPLGIFNSNAIGIQTAESGQDPDTIVWENVAGMLGKLMPGSFKKAVWLAEVSCIPQLLQMAIKLGTAGSYVPIMTGTDTWKILNRPLIITEKLPVLGDEGCLLLADFSQYLILLKEGGFRLETSKEFKFKQDQTVFRMIARLDGQPAINSSLTLKSGTVVYPFVQLGEVA